MRAFQIAAITGACIVLVGCGSTVRSQVSAFHENRCGQRLNLCHDSLPGTKADLEYRTYAKALASGLTKAGLLETNLSNAKYAVLMNYSIDNGKSEISSVPIIGQTGVASSTTYGQVNRSGSFSATTYNTPTYGIVGATTRSDTVFTRQLTVDIVDANEKDADGKYRRLYLGKVQSRGAGGQIAPVMPYMIEALLQDFPGKSGQTKTVDLTVR